MSDLRTETIRKIVKAIDQHQRFLVVTHVRPDGDAVGSVLALTFMLHRLGKTADPYCQDPAPPGHDFLAGAQSIRHGDIQPGFYEVAIFVDCGGPDRVGPALAEPIGRIPLIINIDHHISEAPFGDIAWVEPSASSTCELLYDLLCQLPVNVMDSEIASQLYTGLMTDTGSFRFSNTNQRVLQVASELVAAGANPAYIAQEIFDSASPQRIPLLAKVLSTVAYHKDYRLATAELTHRMFEEVGASPVDSDGFINHLRSVKSVQMAMFFREDEDGLVHVSLRSKDKVDVATFAQRHGGGGHRRAAALHVPGPVESLRPRLTQEAIEYLSEE